MSAEGYLAIDLGAGSGRAMLGQLEQGRLTVHEVHRFGHDIQALPSGLHWDITGLWANILLGLKQAVAAARQHHLSLRSLGVDTWGVDWALLGPSGELLNLPHAYRDPRAQPAYEKAVQQLGIAAIYDATGIQMMWLNTLYQLLAFAQSDRPTLDRASSFLFMPDLFHYFLTGKRSTESTIASTSQMLDARTGDWATALLEKLDLPAHMLGPISPPGTNLGPILPHVAQHTGAAGDLPVILPPSHDTAAAVAAVPAEPGDDWCYLSSGTWSLMGAELAKPVVTEAAREAGFTNEGGVGGTIRFLKNITGLWLVQECRRQFEREGKDHDFAALTAAAEQAQPFRTLVDPDHPPLLEPGQMPEKIAAFAAATHQPVPESPGQLIRCCLESLALRYRVVLDQLEQVLGRSFSVLHIVGGGGKNTLLNQMTADAIDREVIVGPHEATAIGNVLMQAVGAGAIRDAAALRSVVRRSFQVTTVKPSHTADWDAARTRFEDLCGTDATG